MDKYIREYDGQSDFYTRFLPRVDLSLSIDTILSDNTDGVVNGNLLEFKLHVADLNTVLLQCLKYLSAMRVKGKPVPANILVIDLNAGRIWHYLSEPYLKDIETLYNGGASKDNGNFIGGQPENILDYDKEDIDAEKLISLLKEKKYTKINIDENCIVGWAERYYRQVPHARKEDFLGDKGGSRKTAGEIRDPKEFANYINPYTGGTNIRFSYLMDKLNDFLLKKNLGAFYTPTQYCQKALELVRTAITRVPEGNDYIILDRCAGTGNLELGMTDEELSHCIVSTVEYYEYKVLLEQLGDKVRHIIPPTEDSSTFNAGLVLGADALSLEYLENTVIKQYIDNPKCSVILFENPPYAETTSAEHQRHGEGKNSSVWKKSYMATEMKGDIKGRTKGNPLNDIGNVFIWSGFKYYLRQPTDSYIVFSPVKYWKAQHLINKKLIEGYAFNRRHFHTNTDACIMCALWANINDNKTTELSLTGYDIVNNELVKHPQKLSVKRINDIYSTVYYDKRTFNTDTVDGILTENDGLEVRHGQKCRVPALYNDNILCYMIAVGSGFDNPDLMSSLLVGARYNGNGFFLRRDNYLEKLPMFAASRYITYNRSWTERGRIMKSADGATAFYRDIKNGKLQNFFLKCLLFTCLEMQNHMRTFTGSDERFYRNELCFDGTNGLTQALADIKKLKFNDDEQKLFVQWETVLDLAKRTQGYNKDLTYGVYQIFAELDTKHKDEITGKTVWDNVELHSAMSALKALVVSYYNKEIVPVLFDYEFLK